MGAQKSDLLRSKPLWHTLDLTFLTQWMMKICQVFPVCSEWKGAKLRMASIIGLTLGMTVSQYGRRLDIHSVDFTTTRQQTNGQYVTSDGIRQRLFTKMLQLLMVSSLRWTRQLAN